MQRDFFFLFTLDVQTDLFCSSHFDAFEEVFTHRDLSKELFFRASDAQVSQMGKHLPGLKNKGTNLEEKKYHS